MSKILDRIAKLVAQADATNNESERDAFMTKAQELATLAAIDLEVARQHQADKTRRETPASRQITVAGFAGSRVQNNAAELALLMLAVGRQNDLEFDIANNSTYVIAYGMPSDLDVTEALYTSLLVQMTSSCDAAIAAGKHKEEKAEEYWDARTWSTKVRRPDARRFRTAFYRAFISRVSTRLAEARRTAIDTHFHQGGESVDGSSTTTGAELVLVKKQEEVKAFRSERTQAKGSWGGGRRSTTSSAGQRAGSEAGKSARLGAARGIGQGRTSVCA